MRLAIVAVGGLLAATPSFGVLTVKVTATANTPLLVGDPVTVTATVTSQDPGDLVYQFSVAQGTSPFHVVVDYSSYSNFQWTPASQEGNFDLQVAVRNVATGETTSAAIEESVQSRIVNGQPSVNATKHPLVAFYSAPACPVGSMMYIAFKSATTVQHTNMRPCSGNKSMNFYIAGMLPSTVYKMHHAVVTGANTTNGPQVQFKTGTIPSSLTFPPVTLLVPPAQQTSTSQSTLLMDDLSIDSSNSGTYYFPTATDLNGNVIWYYNALGNIQQRASYYLRPVDGGTIMLIAADPKSPLVRGQIWREIDLGGSVVRETNVTQVTAQMNAAGLLGIIDFDHDAIRLPNGHTLILCTQEKIFPAGTQGYTSPVDLLGNAIVDLDQNLQLAWSWSAFDHLDINRAPILGELCAPNTTGCPPMTLAPFAVDWLHGNSLNFSPSTGDVVISLRDQDWLAKIDYANGTGSGAVLWTMGIGGSFSINSTNPYPWFTHQHDAEYELGGTSILSLYDNGNTRVVQNPGIIENSRGMVLNVDEVNMVVTPILSQDLGVYSGAVGSAQRLDNGNYFFTSGIINLNPGEGAQHSEFTLGGTETYLLQTNDLAYRGYRMQSLYRTNSPAN